MDRYNRLAVLLVATFVLVAVAVTLLVASGASDPDFLPRDWFESELIGLAAYSGGSQAASVVVSVIIGALMLGVIFLEIGPLSAKQPVLQISRTPDGILTVEQGSVRLLAERTGIVNRNISSLRCSLRVTRRPVGAGPASIVISSYPRVIMGTALQEMRDDLQTRIRQTVEQVTGLTVERVNVARVRYDRGDESRLLGA